MWDKLEIVERSFKRAGVLFYIPSPAPPRGRRFGSDRAVLGYVHRQLGPHHVAMRKAPRPPARGEGRDQTQAAPVAVDVVARLARSRNIPPPLAVITDLETDHIPRRGTDSPHGVPDRVTWRAMTDRVGEEFGNDQLRILDEVLQTPLPQPAADLAAGRPDGSGHRRQDPGLTVGSSGARRGRLNLKRNEMRHGALTGNVHGPRRAAVRPRGTRSGWIGRNHGIGLIRRAETDPRVQPPPHLLRRIVLRSFLWIISQSRGCQPLPNGRPAIATHRTPAGSASSQRASQQPSAPTGAAGQGQQGRFPARAAGGRPPLLTQIY